MANAVETVGVRLLRAAAALDAARIPYAIAGGNAVALWVSRIHEAAVRATRDVDVLVRRADFPLVPQALEGAGFTYQHAAGPDIFLDGPDASARDAVHLIFASEKVRPHEYAANPDVTESEPAPGYIVLSLSALVRIKLTAFRDKDRTHLRDLIDVSLIDSTWLSGLIPPLAVRLRSLLDTPDG